MREPEAWLEALPALMADLDVDPVGVIHVGAGDGREVPHYRELHFGRIVLVEPLPWRAAALRLLPDVEVIEAAIATKPGRRTLYVTAHDEASSILRPTVWEPTSTVDVDTVRLDSLNLDGLSVLVVDAQGSEVDVLASVDLATFDLIVAEATETARYTDGATRATLAAVMVDAGWVTVGAYPHRLQPALVDYAYTRVP